MKQHEDDKKEQADKAEPTAKTETAASPAPADAEVLKDKLLRLQADFDNFRKRTHREKTELFARANEQLMAELLSVVDHFELGMTTAVEHKTDDAVRHGFQLVYDQLIGVLKKFGLTPLDVHSAAFDPHLHEAVTHVPSKEYPTDDIISQVRRGYKLGDKLLRPIQVVVSSGPGAPRDDEVKEGQGSGAQQ